MPQLTPHAVETRQRIILQAVQAFREKGLRDVRMDDIAHALKISKRTLYQLFSDKEALVIATIEHDHAEFEKFMEAKTQETQNVLELFFCLIEYRMKSVKDCSPCFFSDLNRYPHLVECLDSKQALAIESNLKLLLRGVEEGLFLPMFDYRFILETMHTQVRNVLNDERFADQTFNHCFLCLVIVTLRGCATLRGIELIDRFMQEHELC